MAHRASALDPQRQALLLDVCFEPVGFPGGYEDLRRGASLQTIAGTTISVPVASLADVEHSKRTAGRPKDLRYFDTYPGDGERASPPPGPRGRRDPDIER